MWGLVLEELPRNLLFVIENHNIRDAFGVESVLIELRAAVTVEKTSCYKALHLLP